MTNYATLENRSAPLSGEFGYNYAVRLFGQEAVDSLPVYIRGKNKGKVKGYIHWRRCVTGGWAREYGVVVRPKELVRAWIGPNAWSGEREALVGTFLGRENTTLCASGSLLGDANRRKWMEGN